jgi:hypothetical protein
VSGVRRVRKPTVPARLSVDGGDLPVAVDNALFTVLCFFAPGDHAASQEARGLASDARADGSARKVRRVLEIVEAHGWGGSRTAGALRGFLGKSSTAARGARRIARAGRAEGGPRREARRVRRVGRRDIRRKR